MYIMHLNVKNGVWRSIMPAGIDTASKPSRIYPEHMLKVDSLKVGSLETGPATKEATVLFSVSFFLLIMSLLGDTRSVVLETEAQLLVLCALGVSGITLMSMRVRVYFEWVKLHYLRDKDVPESHSKMIEFVLLLTDVVTIAVSCVLFGVAFNILAVMFESKETGLLFLFVIIVTGMFLLIRVAETLSHLWIPIMTSKDESQSSKTLSWTHVYFAHYFFTVLVLLGVMFIVLFTENHGHDHLRRLESMQYTAMHQADVAVNTKCQASGVQNNRLLHDFMGLSSDTQYSKVTANTHNPVSFKVFAWTRWWQLELRSTTGKQSPALYFCSNGLEHEFGACAKEYQKRPGVGFDAKFQDIVDTLKPENLVGS
jgi:hypothetical protein